MVEPYKNEEIPYKNCTEHEHIAYFQEFLHALEIISKQLDVLTSDKEKPSPVAEITVLEVKNRLPGALHHTAEQTATQSQLAILCGMLDILDMTYEDLAKKAFQVHRISKQIPIMEELNGEDAALIILHGCGIGIRRSKARVF